MAWSIEQDKAMQHQRFLYTMDSLIKNNPEGSLYNEYAKRNLKDCKKEPKQWNPHSPNTHK